MKRLIGIQYLRTLAATMVVVEHAQQQLVRHGTQGLRPLLDIGPAGVDIFLVISGFVAYYTTYSRTVPVTDFWVRRVIRIVPVYWLFTLAFLAIYVIRPDALHGFAMRTDHVFKSFLFYPAFHPVYADFIWPALTPGWVLNYQMFFYLVFGVTLTVATRIRLPLLAAVLGTLVACGLLFDPQTAPLIVYTNPLLLEFLCGLGIGWCFVHFPRIDVRLSTGLLLLAIVLFILANVEGGVLNNGNPRRLALWGVPSILLVAGTAFLEKSTRYPNSRILRAAADGSYSTYLSHYFTLVAFVLLWKKIGLSDHLSEWSLLVVSVVLAHVAGYLAYALVEKPVYGALIRAWKRRNRPELVA